MFMKVYIYLLQFFFNYYKTCFVNIFVNFQLLHILFILFYNKSTFYSLWFRINYYRKFRSCNSKKLRRFIAYTALNQTGFILISLSFFSQEGFILTLIFILIYILLNLSFFILLVCAYTLNNNSSISVFSDFLFCKTINAEINYLLGFLFIIIASIPPFLNFFIKFGVYFNCMTCNWWCISLLILCVNLLNSYFYFNLISWFYLRKITFSTFNNNTNKRFSILTFFKIKHTYLYWYWIVLTFVSIMWCVIFFPEMQSYMDCMFFSCIAPSSLGV